MAGYAEITGRTDLGTGTGHLIPEGERREILQDVPKASAVLQLGVRANMSTKVERQPVLSSLPNAYWVSGDTGRKQTTKQMWDSKYLTAEELAVIVPVPEVVLSDTNYDIWGEIRPRLVEALGSKLDEAVLFGNDKPASWEAGLVPAAIAAGNSVGSTSGKDYADAINRLMGKVEDDDYDVSGFAARRRVKAKLRGLRDLNNGLLFQPSLQAGTPGSLYGEPVIYSDANGAWKQEWVDVIAGDWSNLVVGVRQDITFKIFTEGVISDDNGVVVLNLMEQDTVALRVVARYAFTVANPITRRQQSTTNRYPFAVLEDAGS